MAGAVKKIVNKVKKLGKTSLKFLQAKMLWFNITFGPKVMLTISITSIQRNNSKSSK